MPPQNSSFIPKSGVKTVQRVKTGRRIYVLAYISYIVFFSVLFAVIGVYIYGATVTRSLSTVKEQLVAEQSRFAVDDIDAIKILDQRLATSERLLNESAAPSRLFADIEAIVASNIYFSGMSYKELPNRQFELNLTGRANDFSDIIGQRDLLGNSSLLREATVVDFDYSVGEGNALTAATLSFVFSDTRDLSDIAYEAEAGAVEVSAPRSLNNATTTETISVASTTEAAASTTN